MEKQLTKGSFPAFNNQNFYISSQNRVTSIFRLIKNSFTNRKRHNFANKLFHISGTLPETLNTLTSSSVLSFITPGRSIAVTSVKVQTFS